ncbi:MAG: hypothetical protein Q8Q23_03645 [bacterium]|nr:hypothetical protein [bacterium]
MLKNFLKIFTYVFGIGVATAICTSFIQIALAQWSPPTATPPDGNINSFLYEDPLFIDSNNNRIGVNEPNPGFIMHASDDDGTAIVNIANNGLDLWTGLRMERDTLEKWFLGMDLSSDNFYIRRNSTTNDITIDTSGKVGIGTEAPNSGLHVYAASGNNAEIDIQSTAGAGNHWAIYDDRVGATNDLMFWKGGANRAYITDAGDVCNQGGQCLSTVAGGAGIWTVNTATTPDYVYVSDTSANVGIGTASPLTKLSLSGTAYSPTTGNPSLATIYTTNSQAANMGGGVLFGGVYTGSTQTVFGYIGGVKENGTAGNYAGKLIFGTRANGGSNADMTRMVIGSTGNVGIGISTPSYKLHVKPLSSTADSVLLLDDSSANVAGLMLWEDNDVGAVYIDNRYNNAAGDIYIRTKTLGTPVNAIFIESAGNVGIGDTTPGAALVVGDDTNRSIADGSGDVYIQNDLEVDGTFSASGGADIAERFATKTKLAPGTVVVMAPGGYRAAAPSQQAYDTAVIGVVSDNPAIIMGEVDAVHEAIVAMVGVVTVKVVGPVAKGDLLTTSNVRGHAMTATEPKVGTIIGKALEDFSGGQGLIKVLINLQ